jgi:hypothetical protein
LYLVSDRVLDENPGKSPYEAVYAVLNNAPGPAALICLEGAGPLDYTDYPVSHPVYSALFPGLGKKGRKGRDQVEATLRIMGNFAALLPEPGGEYPVGGGRSGPVPGGGIHIETRSWNLPDLRYILSP